MTGQIDSINLIVTLQWSHYAFISLWRYNVVTLLCFYICSVNHDPLVLGGYFGFAFYFSGGPTFDSEHFYLKKMFLNKKKYIEHSPHLDWNWNYSTISFTDFTFNSFFEFFFTNSDYFDFLSQSKINEFQFDITLKRRVFIYFHSIETQKQNYVHKGLRLWKLTSKKKKETQKVLKFEICHFANKFCFAAFFSQLFSRWVRYFFCQKWEIRAIFDLVINFSFLKVKLNRITNIFA